RRHLEGGENGPEKRTDGHDGVTDHDDVEQGSDKYSLQRTPLPSHAHLFAEEFPLNQRQDENDEKEEKGDGRGIAHLEIPEGLVVQIEHHRQRGVQGPPVPPEITYIWSKTWKVPIMDITTMKKVVGFSIGRVMCQNCCQRLAPSIWAASYRSSGMSCRPAR